MDSQGMIDKPIVGDDVVVRGAFGYLFPGRVEKVRVVRGRVRVTVSFLRRRGDDASRVSRSFAAEDVRKPDHVEPWRLDFVSGRGYVAVRYVGVHRDERQPTELAQLRPSRPGDADRALEVIAALNAVHGGPH